MLTISISSNVDFPFSSRYNSVGVVKDESLLLEPRRSTFYPLALTISTTSPDCGSGGGAIIVGVSGGVAPYFFTLSNQYGYIENQNNGNFRGLGEAVFQVRVTDQEGNIGSTTVTLTNINPPIYAFVQAVDRASSCTSRDASFRVLASGGTPPFEYSLDNINFQASNLFDNLAPGRYMVSVRDAAGCIFKTTNFVANGSMSPRFGCDFGWGGRSSISTCGNDASFEGNFRLNDRWVVDYSTDGVNYQPIGFVGNLSPGVHTFYFRNDIGDVVVYAFSFLRHCPLLINATIGNSSCATADGSVRLTAMNGTPPYSFSQDGINFQPSGEFSNLKAGRYMFTVRDYNGTEYSERVEIADDCPRIMLNQRPEGCGVNNGSITATASGGAAPYRYAIDGINFQDTPEFVGLAAGEYMVTLIDANGNTTTSAIEVLYSCMTVNLDTDAPACGNNNGSVAAQVTGGTAPFLYSIDGVSFQASPVFASLRAGRYTVTVRDANGGLISAEATLTDEFGLTMSTGSIAASCAGNDGQINITAQGGGGGYQYSLAGGVPQADGLFAGLSPGLYAVQVTDANGCITVETVSVGLTNSLELVTPASLTVCEGESTQLWANSNATKFTWTPSQGLSNSTEQNPIVTPANSTTFRVEAELGVCRTEASVMIIVNKAPLANAGRDTVICYGDPLTLRGSGGVYYAWTPASNLSDPASPTPAVLNTYSSQIYSLRVTDENGCHSLLSDEVAITVTPPSKIDAGRDTTIVMNQPFQLNAIDISNSQFTNFTWTPAVGLSNAFIANPVATLSAPVTYTLTARTAAGCVAVDNVSLKVMAGPEVYVPTAFSPNGDGLNDRLMVVTVGVQKINYFRIFNRWGELLFSTTDSSKGWDGTFRGQRQDSGVFAWMIDAVDDKGNRITRRGTVTLIK